MNRATYDTMIAQAIAEAEETIGEGRPSPTRLHHVDKANRKTQDKFLCVDCGYSGLADYIAAVNIRGRASLSAPNVPDAEVNFYSVAPGTSSPASAGSN